MLNLNEKARAHVLARLEHEYVAWLTTVRADGVPQPSPVWFQWDGATLVIYSRPAKAKLRNITRNPRVALHFDSDGRGGNIVILTCEAVVDPAVPPVDQNPEYLQKYADGIARLGMNPASFAQSYNTALKLQPVDARAW